MAFCNVCGAPLDDGAKFCTKCGHAVNASRQQDIYESVGQNSANIGFNGTKKSFVNKEDLTTSRILFTWALFFVTLSVIINVILKLNPAWYESNTFKRILFVLYTLLNASYLIIPLAIKKSSLKIISFVLLGAFALYYAYQNFTHLLLS